MGKETLLLMALTLINLTSFTAGATAETGVNVAEFKRTIEPEFRNVIPGVTGEARGVIVAPMKLTIEISGETLTGGTGVMAWTAITAFDPSASTAFFGAPTTGILLTSAQVNDARENGAPQTFTVTGEAYAGITVS